MEKINILFNNTTTEVIALRNFRIDNNKYFIYTLDQIDEQDYQILYVVKVVNSDNILLGSGMLEETEWNKFVETIKEVIKINKENGTLPIEDLNVKELQGLTINEGRPFKLKKELVALLEPRVQNVEAYDDLIPKEEAKLTEQFNYQQLYEEEKVLNEKLKKENEELRQKLSRIKEITEELV